VEEVTRFNDAADQSPAVYMSTFNQDLDVSKEMFLAILGSAHVHGVRDWSACAAECYCA
jgi:hypothetical protein